MYLNYPHENKLGKHKFFIGNIIHPVAEIFIIKKSIPIKNEKNIFDISNLLYLINLFFL